ncbi:Tet(A)/Tet(B)/Tet(C) family tetracycline efflux MFS transporter [Devosia sp.]|uniref:Tet(A)/Tet(B)/Tet(C) family tetracycline efflux MFS transporter n=1 Tax=Devosia sp. TaxID=1871048 RepID=UPI003BAB2BC3
MNKALVVILATIILDAVGAGLIFPILPGLLKEVSPDGDISVLYGVLLAVYAAMQFVFSPVLGALSDRYGRRPVMLISMAGVMVDYLLMALTPWGWVLVVGRTIAGITSANMAVGTAYITDITPEAQRAQRFGLMGAMMGIGFIIGPALGGLLGSWWLRAPFAAAALLNGLNLLVALFVLPESRKGSGEKLSWKALNPVAPLLWLWEFKSLLPLVVVSVVFGLIAAVPGTIWVLYTADRFGWDISAIGLSLSIFGVVMAASQALLTGFFAKHLGDLGTVILGVAFDVVAYLIMGFADQGWIGYAVTPLFALGGVAQPALQSLFTSKVTPDKQGQLAGVLTSLGSLAGVVGPVLCTALYFSTRDIWLGTVWVVSAVLYVLALPLFLSVRSGKAVAA